jgi:transketolase
VILAKLLLKAFNQNQLLIISTVNGNQTLTASSLLAKLSKTSGVPLSTLKLNAKILRQSGLIVYGTPENPRSISLTGTGKMLFNILVPLKEHLQPELNDKNQVFKNAKTKVLRQGVSSGLGHLPSSLSASDLIASIFRVFSPNVVDSHNSFVLSKGHAAPALYAMLAEDKTINDNELLSLGSLGSRLQSHPERKFLPQSLVSTGSLGQGLSIGVGIALGKKIKNEEGKVIVLVGDGELNEGQIWEAAMSGAHHRLDNLIVVVDRNLLQLNGSTEDIKRLEPLEEKWSSFGWETIITEGHNPEKLIRILEQLNAHQNKPMAIIAMTERSGGIKSIRGKKNLFHFIPTPEEFERAVIDINGI